MTFNLALLERRLKKNLELLQRRLKFSTEAQITFLEELLSLCSVIGSAPAVMHMERFADGPEKEMLKGILEKLKDGRPISEGMEGWFPDNVVQGLKLGEKAGAFEKSIESSIVAMKDKKEGVMLEFRSLLYPALVMSVGIVGVAYLADALIAPSIGKVKNPEMLPSEFHFALGVSTFVNNYMVLVLTTLLGIVVGCGVYITRTFSDFRLSLDRWPLVMEYRLAKAVQMLENFVVLKRFDIADVKAIEMLAGEVKSPYLRGHLKRMKAGYQRGKQPAQAMDTGLFESKNIATMKILADSAELVDALERSLVALRKMLKDRVKKKVKLLSLAFFAVGGIMIINAFGVIMGLDAMFKS